MPPLHELKIIIKGAGDMATGVASRLYRSNMRRLLLLETLSPRAIRRLVAFSEAVHLGRTKVEGIEAVLIGRVDQAEEVWSQGHIPVLVDPQAECLSNLQPQVFIDATLAKHNVSMTKDLAQLTMALGPGFEAGRDVHMVVETKRGHDLGRVITQGQAAPNTGRPGNIAGEDVRRVLRAPQEGVLFKAMEIKSQVVAGDTVAEVSGSPVLAEMSGVLRGMLRSWTQVEKGMKIGDIDPRGDAAYCTTISDKARAVGGGVLEGILSFLNKPV
ncbi:MAG: selenium-dependent molybdenum cofactor biosynthesis protein YqeB [Desulfovermiculus sp.]